MITLTSSARAVAAGPSYSIAALSGSRTIDLKLADALGHVHASFAKGSRAQTVTVLDLLRCSSRYFYEERWLAGRTDIWVLVLPLADYLLSTAAEYRWDQRNSNVARWLSELSGVGFACHFMDQAGATAISMNRAKAGADYTCDLKDVAGATCQVLFEAKGSSVWPIPAATVNHAKKQVGKRDASGSPVTLPARTYGLVFATYVPKLTDADQPAVMVWDPPPLHDDAPEPFQRHITSLAAALSWAGSTAAGTALANAVLAHNAGDAPPRYRTTDESQVELRHWRNQFGQSLLPDDTGIVTRSAVANGEGIVLEAALRGQNVSELIAAIDQQAVAGYRMSPFEGQIEGDHVSTGKDGSVLRLVAHD